MTKILSIKVILRAINDSRLQLAKKKNFDTISLLFFFTQNGCNLSFLSFSKLIKYKCLPNDTGQ